MKTSRKNSKKRPRNLKRTAKRLAAYSAAAAATVAAHDRSTNATDVVHDLLPDVHIGASPGYLFNMVTGATAAATDWYNNTTPGSMRLVAFYPGYPYPYIYTPAGDFFGGFVGSGSNIDLLTVGAVIDSNQLFGANTTEPLIGYYGNLANWSIGDRGFVGIRFQLEGFEHYGWAEVTRDSDAQVTLHGFGYNDVAGAPSQTVDTYDLFAETADFDSDGDVDGDDFLTWQRGFGAAGGLSEGDANGDGAVNDADGVIWGSQFGSTTPGVATAVPEPSSILLFAAGAAGLGLWRRRRSNV